MEMTVRRGEKTMRRGYTTGLCAAAAARGAVLALLGRPADQVSAWTAREEEVRLPLCDRRTDGEWGEAGVVKDAGDDPDVTDGVTVRAKARLRTEPGLVFRAGAGVGTVTRAGLAMPVGEAAINPGPRRLITRAVADLLPPGFGLEVVVSVPGGEEVARRTFNPRLGVEGGISILGTTGIVEPMSEEAFKDSLVPQLDLVVAAGHRVAVLIPGRIGEKAAENLGLPRRSFVIMSNFVGYLLEEAARRSLDGVILFGHHGKLVKVAAGVFHTHSRVADARLETVAAEAARQGASRELVGRLLDSDLAEGVLDLLRADGLLGVFPALAERAGRRAEKHVGGKLRVGVVFTTLSGEILGMNQTAVELGRDLGWNR